MPKTLQQIQFDRLSLINNNQFDGPAVIAMLRFHRHLWRSFVVRESFGSPLFELRDMGDDETVNADTIYLIAPASAVEVLRSKFKAELGADEFGWWDEFGGRHEDADDRPLVEMIGGGLPPDHALIRVWWD